MKQNGKIAAWKTYVRSDLIYLGFVLVIIPLIVRTLGRELTSDELLIKSGGMGWDNFSYYKGFWLITATALAVFTVTARLFVGENKISLSFFKDPVNTAVTVYCLFAVLSAAFSPYVKTSLSGIIERHEGLFVLLSYMAVLLIARNYIKSVSSAKFLFYLFAASAVLVGVIGALQTFGFDIFASDLGKRLVLGSYYGQGYSFSIGSDKTYATLFNPNSAALYAAFLAPIFFYTGLFVGNESRVFKALCFFICALMLVCLYGASSVAGYAGLFAAVFVSVLVLGVYTVKFGKKKRLFFLPLLIAAVIAAAISAANYQSLKAAVIRAFNIDGTKYGVRFIEDIKIGEAEVEIITRKSSVFLRPAAEGYELLNSDLRIIDAQSLTQDGGYTQAFYDVDFAGTAELRYAGDILYMSLGGGQFFFRKMDGGLLTLASPPPDYAPADPNLEIPSIGFKDNPQFATGRGFIWSRSIPLLFKNIFIGTGPDTFAYSFPQHDLLGKLRALADPYIIVDKPHNMYLQTGINTGLISLLALLFIFGCFIVKSLKSMLSKRYESPSLFGLRLGLFSGVCAYLVCALSTDSTVSVAPVFYAGLGFALALAEREFYEVK